MDVLRDSTTELRHIEAVLLEEEQQLRECGYQMVPHSIQKTRDMLNAAIMQLVNASAQRDRDKKADLQMQKVAGVAR